MHPALRLLLMVPLSLPLFAAKWAPLPAEVWAMKGDPALVAQGAVVLERRLDFQAAYFEQSLRVRILSQAGVAAAEISDLPPQLLTLEGQVTFPDGRVQPITRREDFLVRKVVSTNDGTLKEGILIPGGVTEDCVLEVRWREATAAGKLNQTRGGQLLFGDLPERFGHFAFWTLGAAYPTRTCVVRQGKEVIWPMAFLGVQGLDLNQTRDTLGQTYTFRNLPALPAVPFSSEGSRPAPKVIFYRPIQALAHLDAQAPSSAYWQHCVDLYYKDWYLKYVHKGSAYRAFSQELRKDLPAGARDKARVILERLAQRTKNLDQLLYDEKADLLARSQVEMEGVANLEYTAKTGFTNSSGLIKLLFHLLADEGIQPKIALVANKSRWAVNTEIRTPFQFSHALLCVEEPGQATLWLDPADRLIPAGGIDHHFQGSRALMIDSATWQTRFRDLPMAASRDNLRTFKYRIEAAEEVGKVQLEVSFLGAPALSARYALGAKAPAQRGAWFQEMVERQGFTVAKVEVNDCLDLAKPLGFAVEGSIALDPGRLLKIRPFPGMYAALYLPSALPEQRQDPIALPYRGVQEAVSTITVPKGYVLRQPIAIRNSNRWGVVSLGVTQEPSGELRAEVNLATTGYYDDPKGYPALKDYLQWLRAAVYSEITLERDGAARP